MNQFFKKYQNFGIFQTRIYVQLFGLVCSISYGNGQYDCCVKWNALCS